MIEQTRYEKLFYTPLLRYAVPGHDALNSALLAEGRKMRELSDGVSKSNRGGWHSEGNLFDSDAECIRTLRSLAEEAILVSTRKITKGVDPAAFRLKIFGWMNANPPGGYNAPHSHPGAHWSGVYYVSQPAVEDGTSGMIEFIDPRTDLPNWRLFKSSAFRLKRKIRPAAGEIVMFPSYLVHWVYPNETDEERVTIAFNGTFRKPKGSSVAGDTSDETED